MQILKKLRNRKRIWERQEDGSNQNVKQEGKNKGGEKEGSIEGKNSQDSK